jgi:CheY-like chemotaxis protein
VLSSAPSPLTSLMQRRGPFPEGDAVVYVCELVAAVGALHALGYAHCSVAPDNVLIAAGGHLKLADFSRARRLRREERLDDAADEPLAALRMLALTDAVEAEGLDAGRPLRVLAAEDNAGNRHVLQALLEPLAVSLTLVEDGAQALEALSAASFDMVLMDANMPVMDGLTALRAIRASGSLIPVWMLTANVYDEDVNRYRAAGADGVVRKPIALEELFAALSDAAARVEAPAEAEAA